MWRSVWLLLLASHFDLHLAERFEDTDVAMDTTTDAIEVCGAGDSTSLDGVAETIATARGQVDVHRLYRLPDSRIYVCHASSARRGVTITRMEAVVLTEQQVGGLFDMLKKFFPGDDSLLWVLDEGGNLVIAPMWEGRVGDSEENKHGDLEPGNSPFDRPVEGVNPQGKEKRLYGEYRGRARLGGEFNILENGEWQVTQKSGYALQRVPLSLKDPNSKNADTLPERVMEKLQPAARVPMMQRFVCYLRSLGINVEISSMQTCNFAGDCESDTDYGKCCNGFEPTACQKENPKATQLNLRVWTDKCILTGEKLSSQLSKVNDLLTGALPSEQIQITNDILQVRKHFAKLKKSGCFKHVRGGCDLPEIFNRLCVCKAKLNADRTNFSIGVLSLTATCWKTRGDEEPKSASELVASAVCRGLSDL